jgi:hypothetical protein
MKRTLLILLAATSIGHAQDVLEMKAGNRRVGKIISADEKFIRLQLDIPAQSGSALRAIPSISIPRADVRSIEFASDPAREGAIRSAGPQDIPALEGYWEKFTPWLETPRSPSATIACALGSALLATKERRNAERALQLFKMVEEKAWQTSDRDSAREGRLRAMSATGRAEKAIEEAKTLAAETENPEILIEANHLMAQAAEKQLRAFLKENPRWDIDPNVIDERHQLHRRALELYLYPSLFFGTNNEKAARGLWGAVGIYRTSDETQLAIETSRDILTFYPATPEAEQARTYLASLKPDQLAVDWETEAKKELQAGTAPSQAPPTAEPSPSPQQTPKPAKEKKKKPKDS